MLHCTEVRFAGFLSSGFTTMAVINLPERTLVKHTSVLLVTQKREWPKSRKKVVTSFMDDPMKQHKVATLN